MDVTQTGTVIAFGVHVPKNVITCGTAPLIGEGRTEMAEKIACPGCGGAGKEACEYCLGSGEYEPLPQWVVDEVNRRRAAFRKAKEESE